MTNEEFITAKDMPKVTRAQLDAIDAAKDMYHHDLSCRDMMVQRHARCRL
jgi:hypothetical protein